MSDFLTMATQRSQSQRSQSTQQRIVAATIAVIEAQGLQRASMFEIAKAAGLTPGALQHHFTTKNELIRRAATELVHADDNHGSIRVWDAPDLPLAERAPLAVRNAWERMYSLPRYVTMWSVFLAVRSDADLISFIAGERATLRQRIRAGFLQTFPELQTDPDRDAFAETIISAMRGIAMLSTFGEGQARQRALLDNVSRQIVAYCASLPCASDSQEARPARSRKAHVARRPSQR